MPEIEGKWSPLAPSWVNPFGKYVWKLKLLKDPRNKSTSAKLINNVRNDDSAGKIINYEFEYRKEVECISRLLLNKISLYLL